MLWSILVYALLAAQLVGVTVPEAGTIRADAASAPGLVILE